jgi:hypothetical protein
MGCCGQRRSILIAPLRVVRPTAGATFRKEQRPAPTIQLAGTIALRSIANSGIVVRGLATGRQYSFTAATPVQLVDARDAASLLRTPHFRRA